MKAEVLFGVHSVNEALKAGRRAIDQIWIATEKQSRPKAQIQMLAERAQIPVKRVRPSELKAITGMDTHQGIAARVSPYAFVPIETILAKARDKNQDTFLLVLDSVIDPQNLGGLIRTASCTGVDGIILPRDRAAPPSPAVSKASAGALEHVLLHQVTNLAATIGRLKKKGIWIAGLASAADQSLFGCNLTGPLALIVGGEQKGIRTLIKRECDFLLSIPQSGAIDSLNASVAGGIALYEVLRQRKHYFRSDAKAPQRRQT